LRIGPIVVHPAPILQGAQGTRQTARKGSKRCPCFPSLRWLLLSRRSPLHTPGRWFA
jgi:hypothetical protein